jgi:hypothetical protein
MTDIEALADCIVSGQVPDDRVPSLVAETPGLRQELERRSAAMSPARPGEAGRGASISSPDGLRPADPFHFRREPALPHGLGEEVGRRPLKIGGLLSQLIRSLHLPSFLRSLLRK